MAFVTHHRRFPAALVVFLLGLVLTVGIIVQNHTNLDYEFVSPVFWAPQDWRGSDWDDALLSGALPQVCIRNKCFEMSWNIRSTHIRMDKAHIWCA